jgi:hypothetical protein
MNPHSYLWPATSGCTRARRATWGGALVAVLSATVLGCSQGGSTATLSERVGRYWELKQAKRWEEVYQGYLDPALKERISRDAFLNKRKLAFDILSFSITEVREDGDQAVVIVTSESNIPAPAGRGKLRMLRKTVSSEDKWVRRDGVWYVELPS